MRLPESARAVLLFEHAATVWRVHMSRMIRMGGEHAWEEVFESVWVLRSQSIAIPHSIHHCTLMHGISIALHHTPWQSITLHHNSSQSARKPNSFYTPSHSIALHRTPSQSIAAAQAHRLNTQQGSNMLGSSRCSAGSVLSRFGYMGMCWRRLPRGWRSSIADREAVLRRRRGLHRGKQSV